MGPRHRRGVRSSFPELTEFTQEERQTTSVTNSNRKRGESRGWQGARGGWEGFLDRSEMQADIPMCRDGAKKIDPTSSWRAKQRVRQKIESTFGT